jgi:hypothetical protein
MKPEFAWHMFEKYWNIKFKENPSSGSWVAPGGRMHRQTDMMKLLVTSHNFENMPKNYYIFILMVNFSITDSL